VESNNNESLIHKYLPTTMRFMGAGVLVCATVAFLMQQATSWSDSSRFFLFLGFSIVLGILGYVTGVKMSEAKGARTFFLVLASAIPAHFCQLGALIYSGLGYTPPLNVPSQFIWKTTDITSALVVTGVGIVALLPLTLLAFGVLARRQATLMSALYVGLSSLLLLPARDPDVVGLIAMCAALVVLIVDMRVFSSCSSLNTFEGVASRIFLMMPPVLLVARTAYMYGGSMFLTGVSAAVISALLSSVLPRYTSNRSTAVVLQLLSIAPTIIAWFALTDVLVSMYPVYISKVTVYGLTLGIYLFIQSRFAIVGQEYLDNIANTIFLGTAILELVSNLTLSSAVFGMIIGIFVTIISFANRNLILSVAGVVVTFTGIIQQVRISMFYYSVSPWLILASTGIILVLGSSYMERYGKTLLARFSSSKSDDKNGNQVVSPLN
jgi:hypothetical protein